MNDDEFLNDRDCTPKGETPRTDAALMTTMTLGSHEVVYADLARELERELARALRVVEAARSYADYDDHDSANKLKHAFWEWEAGR